MAPNADVVGLVKSLHYEKFCATSIFCLRLEFRKDDISHDGIVTSGPRIRPHFLIFTIKDAMLGKVASLQRSLRQIFKINNYHADNFWLFYYNSY